MAKKILVFAIIVVLSFAISSTVVFASNPSIGQLDNQGETEGTAGITWDQINEMSQNSPNSLSPIQGLVLWMFAILAFLKLAQKMDSLLQSLGLNVTQTGGRAVGDLIMAGMAIKHVGSAFSKGMGMFGFGKGGGTGGGSSGGGSSGSGTGGKSAGGGPAPIPSGSPKPSGGSHGSHSASGKTPSGSTASSGSSHGKGSSTSSGSTPSGNTSSTTATSGTTSRNPVGRFAGWMKNDGFAQGAIKAGAKGGVIGASAYSVKAGASKIGSAVSARFSGDNISSDPSGNTADNKNNNTPKINPTDANTDNQRGVNHNPEDYQAAKPLEGSTDQSVIPTSINQEDYHDSKPLDSTNDSSVVYSSFNDDDYTDATPYDTVSDGSPISVSVEATDGTGSMPSNLSTSTSTDNADTNEWSSAKPASSSNITAPIPATVNDESWNDSSPISQPTTTGVTPTATSSTVLPSAPVTPVVRESASSQAGAVTANEASPLPSQAQQGASNGSKPPSNPAIISSESVSHVRESSSAHDGGTVHDVSSSNPDGSSRAASFESTPAQTSTPVHNQAVPSEFSQSTVHSSGSAYDVRVGDDVDVSSHNSIQQTPIQSGSTVISTDNGVSTPVPQSDVAHSSPTHAETIHSPLPSAAPVHVSEKISANDSPSSQSNTVVQSQITQVHNYTKPDVPTDIHPAAQPTTQVVHVENQGLNSAPQPTAVRSDTSPRPTEKATSRTSTKGRKRKR